MTAAVLTSLLGTFLTALASLAVALINTHKTSNVERSVNGTLSEFMRRWEAEHQARIEAEVELARLQERERLRGFDSDEP